MKNKKFQLGLILFVAGFAGVLSLMTIPLPEILPAELEEVPPAYLKVLTLINPTILLLIAVIAGVKLFEKVSLAPTLTWRLLKNEPVKELFQKQLVSGISGGIVTGLLLLATSAFFSLMISRDAADTLSANLQPTLAARFLYGGITEEILLRFGMMTFLVWLFFKITKQLSKSVYWTGILLSSLLFAALHLPAAFQAAGGPSAIITVYVLTGNSLAGLIFGFLYWKNGLEASIIAHIFSHIVMVTVMGILQL